MPTKFDVKVTMPQGSTQARFQELLEKVEATATIAIFVAASPKPYAFLTVPANRFRRFKATIDAKYNKLEVERTKKMAQLMVKNIPTGTNKKKFEEMMEGIDGTILSFKYSKPNPYAFVLIEKAKAAKVTGQIKAVQEDLEVTVAAKLAKYFIDTRKSVGVLKDIDEENLKSYFEGFGEVMSMNLVPLKGFGFVSIKVGDDDDTAGSLDTMEHEVDGHAFTMTKVTKKGKGSWGKRYKPY